ncbi:LPXTG cell wall anchor domain-containing protein [Streptomyces sp. NPDC020807]|uniref:LPXTG cell wall anchor domain-containing protein n=1 Tax=Streptomyces sp. NPDC020807 TaxID=3155119 RepID=UPI0033DF4847
MKIRRTIATAVAAAVTTPALFLSAAPAFADTPSVPNPSQSKQDASGEEDPEDGDFAEYEKLAAAVEAAEAKIEAIDAKRDAVEAKIEKKDVGEEVATELAEAKKALAAAKTAVETAEEELTKAQEALDAIKDDAPQTEKDAAAKAVEDAEKAVDDAIGAREDAQERYDAADTAFDDAMVALFSELSRLDDERTEAEQELSDAEDALDEFENGDWEECVEDPNIKVALTGPTAITAGQSGIFSMKVSNASDVALNGVQAYAGALRLPESIDEETDEIDEDTDWEERRIQVEWSTTDAPGWKKFSEETGPIELGTIAEGGAEDVRLRLTVEKDTPAGEGVAFAMGAYEAEGADDSPCGLGEAMDTADFDIVAAEEPTTAPTDEPTEEPTEEPTAKPTPSPSTTTPAPVATATTGNSNTTPQGSAAAGALADTGANDSTLPLGLAAVGAVVLGAGALLFGRRRKAGAKA